MITCDQLDSGCARFLQWLERHGYPSYDPYDIWGTRYGVWSRRHYYRRGLAAAPLVAPLIAIDLACPSLRRWLVGKSRYATCDAQLVMGFLNLHAITGDGRHLERAITLGEEIMAYAIPGFHGPCWGYPFDWQNGKGAVWPKNTPYITCTPYCYDAYLALHRATRQSRYIDRMAGIARFVQSDLKDLPTAPDSAAGSYSPFDTRRVVNATAYRAYVLTDAGMRFANPDYRDTARCNLNFVLQSQSQDGSWPYATHEGRSYIDNFHTCFVLKNLFKIHQMNPAEETATAIMRGFEYYRHRLMDGDGNPRPFAVEPRLRLVRLEMYDFAEGINLCTLLSGMSPEAATLASNLAERLLDCFQLPDGHFVTRVYRGGFKHRFPFLRWPQAQLFHALTALWRHLDASASPTPNQTTP